MKNRTEFGDTPPDFRTKKTKYFSSLALKLLEALRLHRAFDLLTINEQGIKDWRNASEHQLVVAARTKALSKLLNLPATIEDELVLAAGVHDFYKRKTVEKTPKEESMSMKQQINAEQEATQALVNAEVPENIISYTNAVGSSPKTIHRIQKILNKGKNASEQETAELVVHYIDDFTRGTDWAKPVEVELNGKKTNDLNRRIQDVRNNPKYKGVDEEGREYFDGKSALDTQEAVGEQVEVFLARKLSEIIGQPIDSKDLPELIDREIKKTIEQYV